MAILEKGQEQVWALDLITGGETIPRLQELGNAVPPSKFPELE